MTTERIKFTKDVEDSTDNQFELLSKLPRVHGGDLKRHISPDYTLAKLNDEERVFIKETYENAGFLKFLIEKLANDSYEYVWNAKDKTWEIGSDGQFKKVKISELKKELIQEYGEYLFKSLMISPDILTVLRRNDETNFMLRLLGDVKIVDESGNEQFDLAQNESAIERLKQRLNEQS